MKGPLPDQTFEPAPICARIRLIETICIVATVVAGGVIGVHLYREPGLSQALRTTVLALCWAMGPLVVAGVWFGYRLKRYALSNGVLRVERAFHSPSFDLVGLSSVDLTENPMKWALKINGNDGLGSISGSFRSKQWGKFKAYLSDNHNAVVLRWTDGRCVIVSPKHTQLFIQTLRKRLN